MIEKRGMRKKTIGKGVSEECDSRSRTWRRGSRMGGGEGIRMRGGGNTSESDRSIDREGSGRRKM